MKKSVIIIIVIVLILAGISYWTLTGKFVSNNYDIFAKCLTEKGVVMYGTKACPYCLNQKKMFGDSFKYINYIECDDNPSLCSEKGVTAVPTWSIDGKLYTGKRTIEELSSLTRCELS